MPGLNGTHRAPIALPIRFGDDSSREAYLGELYAVRDRLSRGQAVVAPLVIVENTARGTLHAGTEVTPADVLDEIDLSTGEIIEHGHARYRSLVRRGFIVEGL